MSRLLFLGMSLMRGGIAELRYHGVYAARETRIGSREERNALQALSRRPDEVR